MERQLQRLINHLKIQNSILFLLLTLQIISCQEKDKTPEFHIEISHPNNDLNITPVQDKIFTLEGQDAHLPYGSTSGEWGYSASGWTEQFGTPIGADIIYFSRYEDTFYHLKANFSEDQIKDYMERAYAQTGSTTDDKEPLQEFKKLGRYEKFSSATNPYNSFSDLVFGFAPKGMVVVWLNFGKVRIELDRFQAEVIKDDQELEEKFFSKLSVTREEMRKIRFLDISPQLWENYRTKYMYKPVIMSTNKNLRLFEMNFRYYNAEQESMFRPWINNIAAKSRAIPKELSFIWETGKDQQFVGRAYFSWEKTNEAFKKAGNNSRLEFRIAPDNSNFEIFLNNEPLKADSTRIFKTEVEYRDSYNDY